MSRKTGVDDPNYGYDQPSYGHDQPVFGYNQHNSRQPPAYGATNTTVVTTQPTLASVMADASRRTDYLVPAVCACLFCFWPTALIAIVYASEANGAAKRGDFRTAQEMSTKARNFVIYSVVMEAIVLTAVLAAWYLYVIVKTT